MEKEVAVREWCLERAMLYLKDNNIDPDRIMDTADMFEVYINTGKVPKRITVSNPK